MSTTVRYKGSVLTTVNNQTRVMKTAGKYMEDDVTLVDVTSGACEPVSQDQDGFLVLDESCPPGGPVYQDQDGYIVLGEGISGGGLDYETGTFSPISDVSNPFISFARTHATRPIAIIIGDTANDVPNSSICGISFGSWYMLCGQSFADYLGGGIRRTVSSSGSAGSGTMSIYRESGFDDFMTETGFYPNAGNATYYFRSGRHYEWIAIWAPSS